MRAVPPGQAFASVAGHAGCAAHAGSCCCLMAVCSLRDSASPVGVQGLSIDDKSAAKMKATGDELVRWACRACAACCAALAAHCTVQPGGQLRDLRPACCRQHAARGLLPQHCALLLHLPFPQSPTPAQSSRLSAFPPLLQVEEKALALECLAE